MVYCGKPSKGCNECRRRKIKCDQTEPSCSQCTKVGRKCTGYRNQLDLMFRDETWKTAQKASSKTHKQRNSKSPSSKSARGGDSFTRLVPLYSSNTPEELPKSLPVDMNEQSICFFMHNYIIGTGPAPGRTGYLQNLAFSDTEAIAASMGAVGMATLANIQNSPELRLFAREQYGHALSLTNVMLRDPAQAQKPEALDTVILLGMFEVITCRSNLSLGSWRNHHEGALALLAMRSIPRPEDASNFRMFTQARGQIISSCLLTSSRAPPLLYGLPPEQQGSLPKSEALFEDVTTLLARLCNLRADVEDKTLTSPELIISEACSLEDEIVAFHTTLWEHYPYEVLPVLDQETPPSSSDDIYGGYYHIYPDYFVPNIYNAHRGAVILVSEIIEEAAMQLSRTSPSYLQLNNLARRIEESRISALQAAIDTCASVPFNLGDVTPKKPDGSRSTRKGKAINGYLLLWPLCLAGDLPHAPTSLREWVVNRFEYIGRGLGIKQAIWMAALLRNGSMRTLLTTLRISEED